MVYFNSLVLTIQAVQPTASLYLREGDHENISSPNYPGDYPNNAFMLWEIEAPRGFVVSVTVVDDLSLRPDDHLYYGEEVEAFSLERLSCSPWQNLNGSLTSKSSSVKIMFSSNHDVTARGFSFRIEAVHTQRATMIVRRYAFISSDGEGQYTMSSLDIAPTLPVGSLGPARSLATFNTSEGSRLLIAFELYCLKNVDDQVDDVVEIGDGIVSGEDTRLVAFSGRTTPDDVTTVSNAGWINIKYQSVNSPVRIHITIRAINDSGEEIEKVKLLDSIFPSNYRNNAYTFWRYEASEGFVFEVTISVMDLEPEHDYLYIGDGALSFNKNSTKWRQYTGNLKNGFTSRFSSLTIIFASDGQNVESGFAIILYTVEAQNPATTKLSEQTTRIVVGESSGISFVHSVPPSLDPQTGETSGKDNSSVDAPPAPVMIMIGASGLITFILLIIFVCWLNVKFCRYKLAKLEERKYYEVPMPKPVLPPKPATLLPLIDSLDEPSVEKNELPYYASNECNIYECVPDLEHSSDQELMKDVSNCKSIDDAEILVHGEFSGDGPAVFLTKAVMENNVYASVQDPSSSPATNGSEKLANDVFIGPAVDDGGYGQVPYPMASEVAFGDASTRSGADRDALNKTESTQKARGDSIDHDIQHTYHSTGDQIASYPTGDGIFSGSLLPDESRQQRVARGASLLVVSPVVRAHSDGNATLDQKSSEKKKKVFDESGYLLPESVRFLQRDSQPEDPPNNYFEIPSEDILLTQKPPYDTDQLGDVTEINSCSASSELEHTYHDAMQLQRLPNTAGRRSSGVRSSSAATNHKELVVDSLQPGHSSGDATGLSNGGVGSESNYADSKGLKHTYLDLEEVHAIEKRVRNNLPGHRGSSEASSAKVTDEQPRSVTCDERTHHAGPITKNLDDFGYLILTDARL